ncbi:MAG TPA: glycosyltransferase [Candidatus Eremiobacteraceae bacterium]|nr:glycosyltransferase [Candidatus Eremiobacteraceae bacterium]
MRILNVTQSYAPFFEFGGPPVKVKALAEGIARAGHDVTVLTADWGVRERLRPSAKATVLQESPFGTVSKQDGVTAIYLPNRLHYRAASWNPTVERYLNAELAGFQIAHIFGLYDLLGPGVAAECRKRKIPYVVEPIGMFVPIVRNVFLKRVYYHLWGREMLHCAAAIIATAERERDELVAGGIPERKIVLRRNGVERPDSLPPAGLFRKDLNLPEEVPLILFLGRLSQKKSPDLLLKAFAALSGAGGSRREPHLAFVGPDESSMRGKLQELAAKRRVAHRVHFRAAMEGDAKWAAYRDANIFVLPSQNENFGNTAAEAVAAGTPVIVTEHCGIAPLLNGVAAIVVKHDEVDLRNAMARLLGDSELEGKLHDGCATAIAQLGWEQPLQQMEEIYASLVAPAFA